MKGVAARERSITVPQGVQANGTHGSTGEVGRTCGHDRLPYRVQECVRRVLRGITHKGKESRDIPGRERMIWQGGRLPRKGKEGTQLGRGARTGFTTLGLSAEEGGEPPERSER